MRQFVLGIGYSEAERHTVQGEWESYGVIFDFVDSFPLAVQQFTNKDYSCVAICSDTLFPGSIELLHGIKPVPVIVLSHSGVEEHSEYMYEGVVQCIMGAADTGYAESKQRKNIQCCLDIPNEQKRRLTVVTTQDFYFCQEYRTVKVKGCTVCLTAKEFDILTLLIKNPLRVFTFEMIVELVWGEEYAYYDRKTVNNHMAKLRHKLKVDASVPDYIVNVHGVGYKFVLNE